MLETRAIVMRVEAGHAFVESAPAAGCGQCQGKGCGASKLSSCKPRMFRAVNDIGASVGDEVVIAVEDGAILGGVGLLYLLPLAMLVMGAWLSNLLAPPAANHDAWSASGAAVGLAMGFLLSRRLDARGTAEVHLPHIVRLVRDE